jgi:hypothetical protein
MLMPLISTRSACGLQQRIHFPAVALFFFRDPALPELAFRKGGLELARGFRQSAALRKRCCQTARDYP